MRAALVSLAAAINTQTSQSFISKGAENEATHLRFCNGWVVPEGTEIEVYLEKKEESQKLTKTPLAFGKCEEFEHLKLEAMDRLAFKNGEDSIGEFIVSESFTESGSNGVLFLVMYNRDAATRAVAFQSNLFSKQANAQIATIDTYQGPAKPTLQLRDPTTDASKKTRAETLHPKTMIAVEAGPYEVVLTDEEDKEVVPFYAKGGESYVVLVAGREGDKVSEEARLIVFPNSAFSFSVSAVLFAMLALL